MVSLPPIYVFSGQKLVKNMLEGAPDGKKSKIASVQKTVKKALFLMQYYVCIGAVMALQKNGSFTSETFCDVIRHLIAKKFDGPALLILDGHNSHHDITALDL